MNIQHSNMIHTSYGLLPEVNCRENTYFRTLSSCDLRLFLSNLTAVVGDGDNDDGGLCKISINEAKVNVQKWFVR